MRRLGDVAMYLFGVFALGNVAWQGVTHWRAVLPWVLAVGAPVAVPTLLFGLFALACAVGQTGAPRSAEGRFIARRAMWRAWRR